MAEIFISYRREDGQASAGRIHDRLAKTFGQHEVFMDVDDISAGADFAQVIDQAVSQCKVLIAVIGHNWLRLPSETANRLLNPSDFVRIEIRSALNRNIRVIPVLVENAQLPKPDDLPDDIKPLLRRNAVQVNHISFNSDTERLIRAINELNIHHTPDEDDDVFYGRRKKNKSKTKLLLLSLFAIILLASGIYLFTKPAPAKPFIVKFRIVSSDKATPSFNEGNIIAYIGKEPKKDDIKNGEATFYNIPDQFNKQKIKIDAQIPGYHLADSSGIIISNTDDYVDVRVMRTEESVNTRVRGSVINQKNAPVRNALINIASGLATTRTNENGDFFVTVPLPPGERTRMKVLVNNSTLYNEDLVLSPTATVNIKIDTSP